ncbi:Fic family protein [Candidatus Woesearchaeota archaeon]|nr:Fic family protein [Candidatus Woesearchaeota archaeon]
MRILTRKRGSKTYFYLHHSIRVGDKVATKEKYLGPEIPASIESIKQSFLNELQSPLYHKFDSIKKHFQTEWARLPKVIQEKEKEEIAIAFTYNTNAIEGSTITLHEAREIIHDKIAPNKPLRDIRETETHSKVFLDMLSTKKNINIKLLLQWHQAIFGETKHEISGHFRDYLVRVGDYVGPDWQDVQKLMSGLVLFLRKPLHPVELAARSHYQFEKIHPFGDGNGRIGRLLMNYILWWNGYPMLIIEYKKRKSYYQALGKDENGFVQYFFRRYLTAHKKRI